MGRNRATLQVNGLEELIERLEAAEGDIKVVAESALKASKAIVTPKLEQAVRKHNRSGGTHSSLNKDYSVKWEGTVASIPIGFELEGEGIPSIFLMYGTPRHAPNHPGTAEDKAMYDAIYSNSTKNAIKKAHTQAFEKVIRRLGG